MTKKLGKNAGDLQSMNRSLILNIIRKYENITRIQLSKRTGLKRSTITNIVNELIESELVIESGYVNSSIGRKSIQLSLNPNKFRLLSLRLTRHHILLGIFDIKLNEHKVLKYELDLSIKPTVILDNIIEHIKLIMKDYKAYEFIGIGISVPGPFIRKNKRTIYSTDFSGWENIDIADLVYHHFKLPIVIEHDANAGALCEWWLNTDFLKQGTLVYLAAGQGIGSGVIVDGKLLTGAIGTFGEIGHTSINYNGKKCNCGNRGCLELYASSSALIQQMKQALATGKYPNSSLHPNSSIEEFFVALKKNDALALTIFDDITASLAIGIINIINTFNPDLIIIGDELAMAGDMLLEKLKPILKTSLLPIIYDNVQIKISKFKMDSALIGAGSCLLEKLF